MKYYKITLGEGPEAVVLYDCGASKKEVLYFLEGTGWATKEITCIEQVSKNKKPLEGEWATTLFYGDTLKGAIGRFVSYKVDAHGNEYLSLFFGRNATGQRICNTFPLDCLEKIPSVSV